MYGKDLIESAQLSKKIVKLLDGIPPDGFFYELFLDENGKKISKSVGSGLEVQDWLKYAPLEVLLFFLYQFPSRQKRLSFDVIPKSVDTYLDLLYRYPSLNPEKQHDTVQWHIDQDKTSQRIPPQPSRINFTLINNLVAAVGTGDRELLLDYLSRYDTTVEANKELIEKLVTCSLNYYEVFIEPHKKYKEPDQNERTMLKELRTKLNDYDGDDRDIFQSMVFDVARENNVEPATFFKSFYQILLGQERGPRFGTFTQLIGKDKMIVLIDQHLPDE
jgi:lysyl-tRNA synthetase class 1